MDALFGAFELASSDGYRRFLRAHARILPAAERAIAPGALLDAWTGRAAALEADLSALGEPLPPSHEFDPIEGDAARWGAIYVVEGSRLGGALLARSVPTGLPRAYLDAKHASGGWRRVTEAIDAADEGAAWRERAVAGAKAMFGAYAAAAAEEKGDE